jgi:AhpD family alkylhydroperoxidase
MTTRLNHLSIAPQAMNILIELEQYLSQQFGDKCGAVNTATWELVKLRVSQLNQCAFCLDMHSKDALKLGEKPERIYGLSAWPDMPFYSNPERAALQWAEHIHSDRPVTNADYQQALTELGEQGLVDLTIAINAINSWNNISRVFKPQVGRYQPSD